MPTNGEQTAHEENTYDSQLRRGRFVRIVGGFCILFTVGSPLPNR